MDRTLDDLIARLEKIKSLVPKATRKGLNYACNNLVKKAKEKFGIYQNGWAQLKEGTQLERVRLGFSPNNPLLRTGHLRDSIKKEINVGGSISLSGDSAVMVGNGSSQAIVGSDDPVMLWQEIGTNHIPPRPVLQPTAIEQKEKTIALFAKGIKEVLDV